MNVLSLFDGMSCGQIALKQLGIHVTNYYASEIDSFAIQQTKLNFPNTIELGDVNEWESWNLDLIKIDLILAGSPCQGFSYSGKQLAFNDPRSKLFFVFVNILNYVKKHNPNVKFILENVVMKKEWTSIISNTLNIFPVNINSNLVSAQNRERLYWSNIKTVRQGLFQIEKTDIPLPKDCNILLKDILEDVVPEKYFLSENMLRYFDKRASNFNNDIINIRNTDGKASTITASSSAIDISDNFIDEESSKIYKNNIYSNIYGHSGSGGQRGVIYGTNGKMSTLCSTDYKQAKQIIVAQRGRGKEYKQQFEKNNTGKTNALTTVQKDNLLFSNEVNTNITNQRIRRLTPLEYARLQTIPDWYQWQCSDSQQYKMLGNGWTIKIIEHILSYLPDPKSNRKK